MSDPRPIKLLTQPAPSENDESQRPLDFALIGRILRYTQPYAARRNWLFVLVVIRSMQLPALTWIVAAVIRGPIARSDVAGVIWGATAFALLAIATQVVMHFRQRFALELGERVVRDLRNILFRHLQQMPMSWYHRTKVGRVISRMGSDIEDVRVGVQDLLFASLVQLGQMFFAGLCMLWYDAWLFLIVLGLAPVIATINHIFHRRLSAALRAMRESFSRVTATLAESVIGIRVTQAFVRQDENARMFRELAQDHSKYNTAVMKTHGLFLPLLELNNQFFMAILLAIGGYRALAPNAQIDIGDLVGFFFMANMFFAPISTLGNQYHQAMTAMAGAERLFALLDTEPQWCDPPDAVQLPTIHGRVEFEHLSFAYEPGRPVLQDITFSALPGQTVALVGHTGSGKSSIINLIAKFYLPTSGRLRIDGHDIRYLSGVSLHRQMGIVLQQNFLFQGTIIENIRVGKPCSSQREIREVIRRLGCLDVFESLPDGLQTNVGERGARLSAGQRQLVCFARAMLADPRILILDEATSCIDTETELRLQNALAVLLQGRTSFVVAHRMSTIRHADLVLVLDQGRIVERGDHDQLVRAGGVYANLYQQFARAA